MSGRVEQPRRIWSDPFFFAILATIGGTYVLLILVMLLADVTFLVQSRPEIPVAIDFESRGDGGRFQSNDPIETAFADSGLTIGLAEEGPLRLRRFDTRRPPYAARDLGAPHGDFGGPGRGAGGGRRASHPNRHPLDHVLLAARRSAADPPRHETIFDFGRPVTLRSLSLARPATQPISVELHGEGPETTEHRRLEPGQARLQLDVDHVTELVLRATAPIGRASVDVEAARQLATNEDGTRGDEGPGSASRPLAWQVVPPASAWEPSNDPATLTFDWADPVMLDRVTLFNTEAPTLIRLYGEGGKLLSERQVEPTGRNGLLAVTVEQEGTARAEVALPPRGAVAELGYRWIGRLRSDFERRHPFVARWTHNAVTMALRKPEIRYSIRLSLISCTMTAVLSLWIAIPLGYLLSRYHFPLRNTIDAVLDIPIILPPLVVGLSLLILFQFFPASVREAVVYEIPAVILAQLAVSCAFAVRTMRATFDQLDVRREQVALTLGCSRAQAFWYVTLPESGRGILTAGTLAWARALGEFGPLLIFAGATRMKTEVLSTTVFLELSVGDLGAAVAVSMIMVVSAVAVLILARIWGSRVLSL